MSHSMKRRYTGEEIVNATKQSIIEGLLTPEEGEQAIQQLKNDLDTCTPAKNGLRPNVSTVQTTYFCNVDSIAYKAPLYVITFNDNSYFQIEGQLMFFNVENKSCNFVTHIQCESVPQKFY